MECPSTLCRSQFGGPQSHAISFVHCGLSMQLGGRARKLISQPVSAAALVTLRQVTSIINAARIYTTACTVSCDASNSLPWSHLDGNGNTCEWTNRLATRNSSINSSSLRVQQPAHKCCTCVQTSQIQPMTPSLEGECPPVLQHHHCCRCDCGWQCKGTRTWASACSSSTVKKLLSVDSTDFSCCR